MATVYRTHVRIIADVLETARQYSYEGYDNGVTVTSLIQKANIPHRRLSSILSQLTEFGLLQTMSNNSSKYRISKKGMEFLDAYKDFKGFAETFGLKI